MLDKPNWSTHHGRVINANELLSYLGYFPFWSMSHLLFIRLGTPIYNTGKKDDENNYRPISVPPLVSKVMERAIQVQLLSVHDENKILSVFQSDFRKKKHSTETAVVYLVDHIGC